jgi:hypothetical protein
LRVGTRTRMKSMASVALLLICVCEYVTSQSGSLRSPGVRW